MQCIILAAGRGTRMGELTNQVPKPLLVVQGKNLLERKLEQLPASIEEVVFVVGYLGDKIREQFGNEWHGKKITYVEQPVLNGTGGAVHCAREVVRGQFMVMMGDDLYVRPDIEATMQHAWAVLGHQATEPQKTGRVEVDERGCLKNITEGATITVGEMMNTGLYVLGQEFFDFPLVKIEGKEEYGLPQTLVAHAHEFAIKIVPATFWRQMTSPEDLITAEKYVQ